MRVNSTGELEREILSTFNDLIFCFESNLKSPFSRTDKTINEFLNLIDERVISFISNKDFHLIYLMSLCMIGMIPWSILSYSKYSLKTNNILLDITSFSSSEMYKLIRNNNN